MIVERHRELAINLGNQTYESARISARVVLDTESTDIPNGVDAWDYADTLLTEALASEVAYWHEITTKKDSFIHLVHEDNKEQETKNV
jgi:hypothetical protein